MTEDEAKTKICCGPRAAGLGEDIECRGSECMAWRVKVRLEVRHKRTGQVMPPDAWRARGDYEEVTVSDGGFCGLAGAPR